MSQRNILAAFSSFEKAKDAEKALNEAGFTDTQVDRISPYPGEGPQEVQNPISGQIDSLSDLTLAADTDNRSAGILNAASEDASGLSDGNPFDKEQNILLTVVTDDQHIATAKQMIQQYGGEI